MKLLPLRGKTKFSSLYSSPHRNDDSILNSNTDIEELRKIALEELKSEKGMRSNLREKEQALDRMRNRAKDIMEHQIRELQEKKAKIVPQRKVLLLKIDKKLHEQTEELRDLKERQKLQNEKRPTLDIESAREEERIRQLVLEIQNASKIENEIISLRAMREEEVRKMKEVERETKHLEEEIILRPDPQLAEILSQCDEDDDELNAIRVLTITKMIISKLF